MQVEVGSIVGGKITGITHFGAFVLMETGQTGMVHISEISNAYVKEVADYLKEDQEVKVMVLSVAEDGKISLSMKRCEPTPPEAERHTHRPKGVDQRPPRRDAAADKGEHASRRRPQTRAIEWQPKKTESTDNLSFEDMLNRFKQSSNDRMSDLKRTNEPRRSRRGTGFHNS